MYGILPEYRNERYIRQLIIFKMSTTRPFAYNTGSNINGTEQLDDLAIGIPSVGFSGSPYFWNGPDEELGYVIAYPVPPGDHPTSLPGDNLALSSTYRGVDISLSNNNQTASQLFGYQMSVLGTTAIGATDKVMFSVLVNLSQPATLPDSHFIGVGYTTMNYQGNPYGGFPGSDNQSVGYCSNGTIRWNGNVFSTGFTLATWGDGDIVDIAIDNNYNGLWVRVNGGDWNNNPSSNPETNSQPIEVIVGPFYPALCPGYEGTMIVQNKAKYGIPSGYNFLGNVTASVGFKRSANKTEGSFVALANAEYGQSFTTGDQAKTWLNNNGYWTSWGIGTSCGTFTFIGNNATTTSNSAINDGTPGWDSSAYSSETFTGPVSVTFQTSANGNILMGGFSYNPTATPGNTYEDTSYGIYLYNSDQIEIYENGGQAAVLNVGAVVSSSDVWKVDYDGTSVKYYLNSTLLYTSTNSVTQPLHIFFPLFSPNEGVTNVCVI